MFDLMRIAALTWESEGGVMNILVIDVVNNKAMNTASDLWLDLSSLIINNGTMNMFVGPFKVHTAMINKINLNLNLDNFVKS